MTITFIVFENVVVFSLATGPAPRERPGGMIEDAAQAGKQALAMIEEGYVNSLSGRHVPVVADTLCLHGDQPGAAHFAKELRKAFKERNISIAAP